MERRPFEIVAECEMAGFPSGEDIEHTRERIEKARRLRPAIVRSAVNPPAVVRDRRYVLPARFVVWAEDGGAATRIIEDLLSDAQVHCRTVLPSGRALTDVPAPPPDEKVARPTRAAAPARAVNARRPSGGKKPRTGAKAPVRAKGSRKKAKGSSRGGAGKARRGRAARPR